jgi:hypothetical protein
MSDAGKDGSSVADDADQSRAILEQSGRVRDNESDPPGGLYDVIEAINWVSISIIL